MRNEIYYAWLENKDISNSYKKIMEEMSEDECSVAFSEKPIQFGTAGYRAKIGPGNHYLNEKTYKQLTVGYAKYLKNKFPNEKIKVLITHDNRYNGMFYTDVVGSTLFENGIIPIIVENNDLLPTPIASYLISKMNLNGGINITASHNPKEYNGFKCYNETGAQILPNEADEIIKNLPSWKDALNSKINLDYKYDIVDKKFIDEYFKDVIKSLPNTKLNKKNLQLVYSSMHGTASYYMSKFLNKLGYICVDVPSQNYPDHNFENALNCNPEDPISLDRAITLADTLNINIVLASDPDADRLAIAIKKENDWIFLNGNQAGIIETYYKLTQLKNKNKTPIIMSTYISNNLIDRIGKKWNAKIIRTPTGFKWIGAEINKLTKDELYINGFEEAIGALPSTINRDKDSFQTAALVLEIAYSYLSKSMDYIDIL
ncbi:MAG: phospho-sugar mutase, partial [Ureaplasma sp.]|nr:phospho-sugar mutase [Ureaplasma sp.]